MKLNLKTVVAAALVSASFATVAQESIQLQDGPYTRGATLVAPDVSLDAPPQMTEETMRLIGRDPANLGRMMATYVGTMPTLMEMCGWEEERAGPIAVKTRRVVELFYGGMSLEMQIPFAEGYFTMEEKFVTALNESSDKELSAVCNRLARDEKEMNGVLDNFLEPLEKAVLRGELKPMNPYEGRGEYTLKSTGDFVSKGGDLK